MSIALLLPFKLEMGGRPGLPVAIDPLAVSSVEYRTYDVKGGTRLVTDSGRVFDLSDDYELVVAAINKARIAIAQARRDGA
jgi:hypothetical protein